MKQSQSIGSNNEQQGLPDERNENTSSQKPLLKPHLQQPVKPAVTDDEGNIHGHRDNESKGYSETKPTEPHSPVKPADDPGPSKVSPEAQHPSTEKVYGAAESETGSNGYKPAHKQTEEDAYEEGRRREQSAGANG